MRQPNYHQKHVHIQAQLAIVSSKFHQPGNKLNDPYSTFITIIHREEESNNEYLKAQKEIDYLIATKRAITVQRNSYQKLKPINPERTISDTFSATSVTNRGEESVKPTVQ